MVITFQHPKSHASLCGCMRVYARIVRGESLLMAKCRESAHQLWHSNTPTWQWARYRICQDKENDHTQEMWKSNSRMPPTLTKHLRKTPRTTTTHQCMTTKRTPNNFQETITDLQTQIKAMKYTIDKQTASIVDLEPRPPTVTSPTTAKGHFSLLEDKLMIGLPRIGATDLRYTTWKEKFDNILAQLLPQYTGMHARSPSTKMPNSPKNTTTKNLHHYSQKSNMPKSVMTYGQLL